MRPSNLRVTLVADGRDDLVNMKALRAGLNAWGRYWAFQELGKGFTNRSACDKLGEVQVYGGALVRELSVPKHVVQFDRMIECLSPNCIRAIRTCYVCKGQWALMGFDSKKSYVYWLRRAEIQLVK
ncbi:hypothetical protein RJP56_11030 [Shewanella baltica]|uniref:Uncharacterized protein n=1 Tax=Shewanella scandinavica TaxID=3063538 RepID=A0ABU3G203_9GAMM|nr:MULTISPECIES: hypothetical protein [Shewanella]MDR9766588.1 hypothetical protein [Shewanella baltica]MDT3281665.1 hypothetical protein [Shewanella sp. SP2S1-2]MDT3320730.1 hypothetical protein [Shewanella sp. SP1S2-4]